MGPKWAEVQREWGPVEHPLYLGVLDMEQPPPLSWLGQGPVHRCEACSAGPLSAPARPQGAALLPQDFI